MHYLIDGHNLIARLPDISLDDPNDEIKLVLRLQGWTAASRRRRVTVIFDGGLPGGKSLHFSNALVKVVFASVGKTADALLIGRIQKVRNPSEYTLVSSDRQIIAIAAERDMPYLLAEEFSDQLIGDQLQGRSSPKSLAPDEAEDPQISEAEVAEWLDLFGPEPEPKPKPPKPREPSKRGKAAKSKPAPGKRRHHQHLEIAKSSDRKLSADEIDEWLNLFDDDSE